MTARIRRFAGRAEPMADLSYSAKRLIMQVAMASEIVQLGLHLDRISERNRLFRDFTLASLVRAIREVIAAFPVYRTYVGDPGDEPSGRDRGYIDRSVAEAKRRNPTLNVSIFDFLRDALLMRHPQRSDELERAERRHFAMRFQQTTGPVTAKGVEDTALYVYNRLVSLNEVGSDPARYGESVASYHEKNTRRLARWPDSLVCTSTHDTKRGEDVRARISVLSEVPAAWEAHVRRWRVIGRRFKRELDGRAAPDRNDEYLLYQTLVGAWPAPADAEADGAIQPPPLRTTWKRRRRRPSAARAGSTRTSSTTRLFATSSARLLARQAPSTTRSCPFSGSWPSTARSTRSPRLCSRSRRPASRTSTRAPSCGTSR